MCSLRSRINGTRLSNTNLAGNTTVQVGYVGQKGTHLMVPFDYAQRQLQSDGTTAPSPYFRSQPDALQLSWATLLKVREGATVSGTKSNGNMTYNSLQAVLQKR